MNIFSSILKRLWLIISTIIHRLLLVIVFCLNLLKELFEPKEYKEIHPEYATKRDLYVWLDEYFKQKEVKNSTIKIVLSDDNDEVIEINPREDSDMETISSEISSYNKLPPIDLLSDYPQKNNENIAEETENKKQLIKQTLGDFGISVTDIIATVGATVTLYELILARGVSANKIKTIDEDIARNLRVQAVRIISPFKDRGTVALEVPNNKSQTVGLKSIVETADFQQYSYELPLVLGKTIDNMPQIIDLVEMPHILVGGTTGSGKSVCLNAMLSSLLCTKNSAELKLLLIDPKINEFSIYKNIGKRFAAPNIEKIVFTNDLAETAIALQSLCEEMTRRQILLDKENCRNIQEYNTSKRAGNADYLPRIVVVIDEFADLMNSKPSENAILELARKGRAAGIHLIAATQRPSAKIISGDITANFPARIAFKVKKRQNSEIILGESGAEKLIGKGDMLFSNNSELERLQGAFISTDEVRSIVEFIEKQ